MYPYPGGKISPAMTGPTALYGFLSSPRPMEHKVYGPESGDLMSYCAKRWLSDYTYEGILDYLIGEFPLSSSSASSAAPARLAQGTVGETGTIIAGTLSLDGGSGAIGSVYEVDFPTAIPSPEPGDYAVRFEDAGGAEIATYPFEPNLFEDVETFAVAVPAQPDAEHIVLLAQGAELDRLTASATPPTVAIIAPAPGETTTGDALTIEWSGNDLDGDPLIYALQYSDDDGMNWQTLRSDIDGDSYTLDLSTLPGSDAATIRVIASDGFNSATATLSGVFTVPDHDPDVAIAQPTTADAIIQGDPLLFQGTGYDPEDGLLADASLEWSSNKDGLLGEGSLLEVDSSNLTPGVHTITLTATDSDAANAATSVFVTVYESVASIPKCKGRTATMVGTAEVDLLMATSAADVLVALGGEDQISGLGANDLVCGGGGKDKLVGGAGNDVLLGGGGNDLLVGGPGKDSCIGNAGTDRFKGCEKRKH